MPKFAAQAFKQAEYVLTHKGFAARDAEFAHAAGNEGEADAF